MNFIVQVAVVVLAFSVVESLAKAQKGSKFGSRIFGVKPNLPQNRQFGPAATLTVTEFRTITQTITTSTSSVCGKLVNVTGACRRRRGMWQDEPVVMTFDEGLDFVDEMLSPTATLKFESTPLVQLNPSEPPNHLKEQPSPAVIQPSSTGGAEVVVRNDDDPQARFGFGAISRFIFDTIFAPSTTVTVTVTFVDTSTETLTLYTLLTFFIQNCTPSPFPFTQCAARK